MLCMQAREAVQSALSGLQKCRDSVGGCVTWFTWAAEREDSVCARAYKG